MAGGFNFSIDFDSSQFKRGSDDAAASLEKLTEAMEDVERSDVSDAERGVADLGDSADTAAGQADDLGREFTDAFEKARRDARDAADDVEKVGTAADDAATKARDAGDTMGDAFDGASDSARGAGESMGESLEGPLTKTQDLANEIRGSIGESMGELAGSFAENGFNMADTLDGVVEVAAEAAQALPGPWGLAGGALVAVAAGVYGEWQKRTEQIAADASAMYQDMLESGADFISDSYFQSKLQEFFDPMGESYDANMEKIDLLEDLGVPTDAAARALVGYGDEADRVLGQTKDLLDAASFGVEGVGDAYDILGVGAVGTLAEVVHAIEDSKDSTDTAKRAVDNYRNSIGEIPGSKETIVDVDDEGSVRDTQRKIDDVKGTDAEVRVTADTSSARYALDGLRNYVGQINIPVTAGFVGGSFYG